MGKVIVSVHRCTSSWRGHSILKPRCSHAPTTTLHHNNNKGGLCIIIIKGASAWTFHEEGGLCIIIMSPRGP